MTRSRRLQLVSSPTGPSGKATKAKRRRRPPGRLRRLLDALLLMAAGLGLLVLLMQLPQRLNLDSLLLVSTAIAHLIGGLSELLLGVVQLVGVMVLVLLALLALLLLVAGLVRFVRALLQPGRPGSAAKSRAPS